MKRLSVSEAELQAFHSATRRGEEIEAHALSVAPDPREDAMLRLTEIQRERRRSEPQIEPHEQKQSVPTVTVPVPGAHSFLVWLLRLWCRVMHRGATTPIHGRYKCTRCWMEFESPYE